MMNRISLLTLVLIAVLLGGAAWATDLPAQEARIWAPTGDAIGTDSHVTVGVTSWDPHGSQVKYAEDWQQEDDQLVSGLFAFDKIFENSRNLLVRGYGQSGRGTFAGRFTLDTGRPAKCDVNIDVRNFHNFYDATAEMRDLAYSVAPMPAAMDPLPGLDWRRESVDFRYNLGQGLGLELGFANTSREGDKASLLGGGPGLVVPTRKSFDTTTQEFSAALAYAGSRLNARMGGVVRNSDGNRTVGEHTYTDDQKLFRAGGEVSYRLNGKTSLLGMASTSRLEATQAETWSSSDYSPTGETKGSLGRLGVITRLGKGTLARVTVGINNDDTDYQTDLASAIESVTSRERKGMDLGLNLTNTGLAKARIRLDYRMKTTDLDQTTTSGGEDQTIDQKKTDHRLTLKVQRKLSPKASLRAHFGFRSQKVEQTNAWTDVEPLFYVMGDRKVSGLNGRVACKVRPSAKANLSFGAQLNTRKFEREDVTGVETRNSGTSLFAGLNLFPSKRVTFLGYLSYGIEKQEITDGPVSDTGMAPLIYESKTLRFAPGVMVKLTQKLGLEGHYEGIRFEDDGDQSAVHTLNSDLDRMLLRCGYQLKEDLKVSATYRRHEFDENRWDDYIMDLYSLSVSGRF